MKLAEVGYSWTWYLLPVVVPVICVDSIVSRVFVFCFLFISIAIAFVLFLHYIIVLNLLILGFLAKVPFDNTNIVVKQVLFCMVIRLALWSCSAIRLIWLLLLIGKISKISFGFQHFSNLKYAHYTWHMIFLCK